MDYLFGLWRRRRELWCHRGSLMRHPVEKYRGEANHKPWVWRFPRNWLRYVSSFFFFFFISCRVMVTTCFLMKDISWLDVSGLYHIFLCLFLRLGSTQIPCHSPVSSPSVRISVCVTVRGARQPRAGPFQHLLKLTPKCLFSLRTSAEGLNVLSWEKSQRIT